MGDFYVVIWKKSGRLDNIRVKSEVDYSSALKYANGERLAGNDTLIVEKIKGKSKQSETYKIHKHGFYYYVKFFTEWVFAGIILTAIILYLYFKFKN